MDLPIAVHNIEVKIKTIKKHIKYALEDLESHIDSCKGEEILDQLLDRMDNGTDNVDSPVPNRIAGDLSLNEELKYLKSITLTKRENYYV
jgi:hypothetical protein